MTMDKLPEDWLFVTLNRIEEAQGRHAAEMRLGFQSVREVAAKHELADAAVEARVTALEKAAGESSTFKRSLEMVAISSGLMAAWDAVKYLKGWK
jgi:hypothetical protein